MVDLRWAAVRVRPSRLEVADTCVRLVPGLPWSSGEEADPWARERAEVGVRVRPKQTLASLGRMLQSTRRTAGR